jgi:hypothetical protein
MAYRIRLAIEEDGELGGRRLPRATLINETMDATTN